MSGNLMHMAYVNWLEEHGAPIPVPPGPTPVPPGPVPPPEPSPYPQDWVLLRFTDPSVDPTGHGNLVHWEKKTDSAYNDWYLRIGSPKRDAQYFYEYLLVEVQEVPDYVVTKSGNDVTLKFPHDEEYPITQEEANDWADDYIGEGVLAPGSTATSFVGDEMDGIIFHCAEADEKKYPGYRIGPEALYNEFGWLIECTLVGNVCTLKLPQPIVEILEEAIGTALNTDSLNSMIIPQCIEEGMLLEGTKGTVTFETIGDEEFAIMTVEGPSGEFIPDDAWEPNLYIGDDMKFEIIDDDWAYSHMSTGLFYGCTGLTAIKSAFTNLTDGSRMFEGCSELVSIPENAFVNLTTGINMFAGCTELTSISENLFPNLIYGSDMFYECTGLTSIPEGAFPNLTDGRDMFDGCESLESLPMHGFASVTGYRPSFYNCTKLSYIPPTLFPNVTDGNEMFINTGITHIEPNTFPSMTSAWSMFANCNNFTELPVGAFPALRDAYAMFYGCVLNCEGMPFIDELVAQGARIQGIYASSTGLLDEDEIREKYPLAFIT